MMRFTIISILIVLLISCSNKQSRPETKSKPAGLWMNKITMIDRKRTDSIYVYEGESLDIRLRSANKGSYYLARQDFKPTRDHEARMRQVVITDSLGKALKFTDTTAFLNHMALRGYEKTAAKSRKYGFIYTLKRSIGQK